MTNEEDKLHLKSMISDGKASKVGVDKNQTNPETLSTKEKSKRAAKKKNKANKWSICFCDMSTEK